MERTKVKKLAHQIRGVSYKPEDLHDNLDDNSVILLRANNIDDGKINFDDVVYVDKSKVSDDQYLLPGDILICASSGSKQLVGKAASVSFDKPCTFGAFCKVVRPNSGLERYLGTYFQSGIYRREISAVAIGANINNIRNEHIDALELPLYSKDESLSIVTRIELLQGIIDKRKTELEKLDELIKARFVELFGDLMENPLGWPVMTIADVSTFLKSGLSRKLSDDDIGLPVIRSGNIQDGQFIFDDVKYWYIDDPQSANTKDYILNDGDVLVNFINSSSQIGKTAIYRDTGRDCIYTTNIFRMKLADNCNEYYYNWFAMSDYYYRHLQSIIQPAVNQASFTTVNFLKLPIPLPPKEKQGEFADFVKQVDKSKVVDTKTA